MIDPTYSMPTVNWEPTASFRGTVTPPAQGPDEGTLVQLPCINQDWLMLLLGCVQQLWNPSTYIPSLTESQRADAIAAATKLSRMLGAAIGGACVNPIIGLSLDDMCNLVATFADGSHSDVYTSAQACSCSVACTVPLPPANPRGITLDQFACNIAGFLATEIIQGAMSFLASELSAGKTVTQFVPDAVAVFATKLPFTAFLTLAFYDWYQATVGVLLSEVEAVASDASLWSTVTCVIFTQIRADGQVQADNFAAVGAALAAISYPRAWVPPDLATYWANVGLDNWMVAQSAAALDDVDCSSCGTTWCHEIDFTASNGGWILTPSAPFGAYVAGAGWFTTLDSGAGVQYLSITSPVFPGAGVVTGMCLFVLSSAYTGGGGDPRIWFAYHAGTLVNSDEFPSNGAYPVRTKVCQAGIGELADQMLLQWTTDDASGDGAVISKVQIIGTGINPFGLNNCTE